jgi:hypothetical protein
VLHRNDPVKDKRKRFGLFTRLSAATSFPTLVTAGGRSIGTHAVNWVEGRESPRRHLHTMRVP